MTSDIQLLASLKVSLSRVVAGWPSAKQGEDVVTHSLAGVDLTKWNDAYAAQLTLTAAANATVDLQNWTDLLFEAGKLFDKVFAAALHVDAVDPAFSGGVLEVSPGAVNPLQWFFRGATQGVRLWPGYSMFVLAPATDIVGFVVDATHRNLLFANTGADSIIATVVVLGGHP